jgi:hypothetical protein
MRISFDVDDTLVCRGICARDPGIFPDALGELLCEPLRAGTRSLIGELKEREWSVCIYTTSLRTPFQIRFWLMLHGITVDRVVNDDRHRRELAARHFSRLPSKYPPAFDIDLHVDDSEGVGLEGQEHGFKVVVVEPGDAKWAEKVLNAAGSLQHDELGKSE